MSEEPKSIWKRPIKGWRLFVAWLAVLTSLTVLLALLVRLWLIASIPDDRVFWRFFIGVVLLLVPGILFLRWLCCWRNLRRLLIGLACLVTLVALFYAEENFRGKRAWEKYRQEAEARGEQLDWKAFIPKPVPDEENFAATPLIKSWFVRSNHALVRDSYKYWRKDDYGRAMDTVSSPRDKKDGGNRHFTDLVAWRMAFDATRGGKFSHGQRFASSQLDRESRAQGAPTILEGLKTNATVFAEFRLASQRPYSRYPIDYDVPEPAEILLPHLHNLRAVCQRLQLKACAELALGQSEEALDDVKLSFSLVDSVKEEPFLISYLVRVACLKLTIQPIWEGLAERAWSEGQLRELERRLQEYDFVADLKRVLDAERACGVGIIDYIKHNRKLAELVGSGSDHNARVDRLARVAPSGWYDQEQLSYCQLYQLELGGTFDPTTERVFPARVKDCDRAFDRAFSHSPTDFIIHHRMMAGLLLPGLGYVVRKAAPAQTASDEAALACALERYRLANGQFPDKLDVLVPAFVSNLPHDPITGEPYKYRRTDVGSFVLYAVGWNEKDDGGVPGRTDWDEKEGDWVWQYPPSR